MKKNIHPQWNPQVTVTCACGNTFVSGSTRNEIRVELCSKCHPFFTGQEKLVDTEGRIDKFRKKAAKATKIKEVAAAKQQAVQAQKEKAAQQPKTLKEMLQNIKRQRKRAGS